MYENQHYGGDRPMKSNANGRQAQEEASFRKAAADTQFFWNQVTRNNGALRKTQRVLNPHNKAREESQLFGNHTDVLQGVIQDSIPVERSGPGADAVPVLEKFSDLNNLPSFIARNIRLMKYESPSPIQKHSVPLGLAGLDLMCCAQTGSGKTFAFLLPVIASIFTSEEATGQERSPSPTAGQEVESGGGIRSPSQLMGQIDERGCMPKAIILAPTRELACQIHTESKKLCHNSDMKTVVVYGGSDIRAQLAELSTGCDMIVATPGRLNDLVDRGVVSFCKVIFLVLDEADRMLDMGFEPQIRRIVQENDMPSKETRQTFLFSATFPDEIQSLAREFLRDYVWIGVGRVGSTVDNIEQRLLEASSDPNVKMNMLLAAINEIEGRTLVFVQKKRTAAWVCQCLQQYGVPSEEIHGDRTQMQREHALRQFREGRTRVLVATDVAARGLDVPAVTHVIQFDMPISSEDFDTYVHRIGRTGRAGKSGVATSFYVPGRETGEGNGKIAQLIMRLLQENNQVVPDWFMSIDDHRYGGGGAVRRAPFNNKGPQGRGLSFGGRDVRGYQPQQGGYGAGGYGNSNNGNFNQSQQQQGQRMAQQGQGQYKQYDDGYQQQQVHGQVNGQGQGQGQAMGMGQQYQGQGQSGYQHQGGNQHQQSYMRQQAPQQLQGQQSNAPRYAPQGTQVGPNPQYGQQGASYGTMVSPQGHTPSAAPSVMAAQGGYYDNSYGMVYSAPGGTPASGMDAITGQMAHMGVTQSHGHQRNQYSADRSSEGAVSYVPGAVAGAEAVPRMASQASAYQQAYMAVPPTGPTSHYEQGGYTGSQGQGHGTLSYGQNQSSNYGGGGRYGNTGRGGGGGGGGGGGVMGGRALNVDARPFNAYAGAQGQGQGGRDYSNQGQGQGHMADHAGHQGGAMGSANNNYSQQHSQQQQQIPYSATGELKASNGHSLHSAQNNAYATSLTPGGAGPGVGGAMGGNSNNNSGGLGVGQSQGASAGFESQSPVNSNSTSNSNSVLDTNQHKSTDASTSA